MSENKDSKEAVEFLSKLSILKDWTDDDPSILEQQARDDEGVKKLCHEVVRAAGRLHLAERGEPYLFAGPVDPAFLKIWRDYESRFEPVLAGIWLQGLFKSSLEAEKEGQSRLEIDWENADFSAQHNADLLNFIFELAQQAAPSFSSVPMANYSFTVEEAVYEGISCWEALNGAAGLDVQGILRRRDLVPFVLIPRHLANKLGSVESSFLIQNLKQAHDAFIFGAPRAALALMRSVMEVALRDFYEATGENLSERINSVRQFLPRTVNIAALHRLRRIANSMLHVSDEVTEPNLKLEGPALEKEIVSLLVVLRALIEGTPQLLETRR
jgi:hypothetical protein